MSLRYKIETTSNADHKAAISMNKRLAVQLMIKLTDIINQFAKNTFKSNDKRRLLFRDDNGSVITVEFDFTTATETLAFVAESLSRRHTPQFFVYESMLAPNVNMSEKTDFIQVDPEYAKQLRIIANDSHSESDKEDILTLAAQLESGSSIDSVRTFIRSLDSYVTAGIPELIHEAIFYQ